MNRTCAAALAAILAAPAIAQGFYVGPNDPPPRPWHQPLPQPQPVPPLVGDPRIRPPIGQAVELGLLQVRARIEDGACATEVEQTFRNLTDSVQEGTWILPLPQGAVADRFTMTINGVEQRGSVLDANAARQVYENIVRQRRDPGLLEYMGQGALRARIFPIPPRGEALVKVRWAQVLPQSGTFREWRYPVRAAFLGGTGPKKLTLTAEIRSKSPIKSVYSPFAGIDIRRDGEHRATATLGLETGQVPPNDLSLLYGVAEQDFGCHVLSHRPTGTEGWFLMMLAPKHEWPDQQKVRRAVTFVLDTSGSMAGEKIEQARGALRSFLGSLRREDFFNVVPFSSEAQPFFESPLPATAENIRQALARVDAVQARGGTNIEDALTRALGQPMPEMAGLVPITVFLTDGLPTVGTTDVNTLLAQIDQRNVQKSRVFVFGVGYDVNTRLLDTIAERSRGDRDYVQPGENIEVKSGALFARLSGPVLTNVEVKCEGDGVMGFDVLPSRTPDMFVGTTLMLVGRYRGSGEARVTLRGRTGAEPREYSFRVNFAASEQGHDWLPALWAQKKVAFLMDQIRVNGSNPELVAEITRLGKEHGIVTPYTSHLIVEQGMHLAQMRGVRVQAGSDDFYFGMDHDGASSRLQEELLRAGRFGGEPPRGDAGGTTVGGSAIGVSGPATAGPGLAQRARDEADKSKKDQADQSEVGRIAVMKSAETKALAEQQVVNQPARSAVGLTHQRIGSRQFHLLEGVWVDADYRAEMKDKVQKVEAFSDAWFKLIEQRPNLARVFAFSTRIVVVDGDQVIEVG